MRTVTKNDLADVLVWVRGGRFPGEWREADALLTGSTARIPRCPEHDPPLELRQDYSGP